MKRTLATLCLTALCAGCTQFPELDFTQTAALEAAEYPALVPIEPIIAGVDQPGPDPVAEQTNMDARLAGLRARADRLRGGVLSAAEKKRLEEGLR